MFQQSLKKKKKYNYNCTYEAQTLNLLVIDLQACYANFKIFKISSTHCVSVRYHGMYWRQRESTK